tara:strand:+ start:916 stop:1701 length:786 start_codon:yes stop_codon:yes gene_type:complete
MRIVTWNVNGIRAAIRKGLDTFVTEINPDVLLLQEVRALEEQLPKGWVPSMPEVIWHPAEKKGYSGVSTWGKSKMVEMGRGLNTSLDHNDSEGRLLHTKHPYGDTNLHCVNVYLPSGSSKEERQMFKESWMDDLLLWSKKFTDHDEPVLLCGDLNIAHTEDDIWNPSGNRFTSGFLPHERQWFTDLLNSGWHDLFRNHVGEKKGLYSWWSNRGQARAKDRGWRIDYILANNVAKSLLSDAKILREGGLQVSDHAPVIIDLI